MRTRFRFMNKLCCMLMLCLGVLTGCDGDNGLTNLNSSTIRPCKLDMAGVEGFVVASNTASNAASTKAPVEGEIIFVGDELPVGTNTLYTIDANGELHLSIFYFEVVENEDADAIVPTSVMTELSNVLQIVPSLVTDLGKYILFSACKYELVSSGISDTAKEICKSFLARNGYWYGRSNDFLIRKSDGALFDISGQDIFAYCILHSESINSWWFSKYYSETYNPITGSSERSAYIPSQTYTTSAKNNLFVRGWDPSLISRIEDAGDSIRVKQMTHGYTRYEDEGFLRTFAIDKDENIYEFFWSSTAERPAKGAQLDIYHADGRFDVYNLYDYKSSYHDYSYSTLFDFVTDDSSTPYIFLCHAVEMNWETGLRQHYLLSANMTSGKVSILAEDSISSGAIIYDTRPNYYYLGYYNNCFNWYLPIIRDENNKPVSNFPAEIFSYDKTTNKWSVKPISTGLMQIINADYDAWISGAKCYGANVKGNSVEVTEVDIISETSRIYTFSVDLSSIIAPVYCARMMQDTPYLVINGRSAADGTGVSIMINLVNGDNNSTFATDNRSVVSFFRIN